MGYSIEWGLSSCLINNNNNNNNLYCHIKKYCIHRLFKSFRQRCACYKLFIKLTAYGIHGALLLWIENYLTDRKHCVLIDSAVSDYCFVLSGVPQGTVIGLVLLIIYVNDLPLVIKKWIKTKLFADDAKFYDEIESISNCLCIQESLNTVSDWSDIWQLTFYIPKCMAFYLGKNNSQFVYKMKGASLPIPSENTVADLGFMVSKDLTCQKTYQ